MAHAGGRPSAYDPAFCEQVIELGKQGKLPAQIGAAIGVTKTTLHEWAKVHPEFSNAFDLARIHCEAYHLEHSVETARGERQGNAGMAKFILSAAFGYREGSDVTQTQQGPNGGAIQQEIAVRFVDNGDPAS